MPGAGRHLRDGTDWSGMTGRAGFAVATCVVLALSAAATAMPPFSAGASLLWGLTGIAIVPWLGHGRRRLRDIGWPGWLTPGLVLPVVNLGLTAALLVYPARPGAAAGARRRWPLALACLAGLFVASHAVWHLYLIPAGSMKPVLRPGDRVLALRWTGAPGRGDLAILTHPVTGETHVKRIAALPGDSFAMQEGQVVLNGSPVPQQATGPWEEPLGPAGPAGVLPRCSNRDAVTTRVCVKAGFSERLPGEARPHTVLDIGPGAFDTTPVLTVPEGHLVLLGDNRDNSLDSRVAQQAAGLGFVPASHLLARPFWVIRDGRISRVR